MSDHAINCQPHEPFEGRCIHCNVPFQDGRPAPPATYRLLERGEVVQRGDEVLADDTVNWLPLAGWEVGMEWNGAANMPVRRRSPPTGAQHHE